MVRLIIDCNCLCYKALWVMGDLSQDQKKVGVVYGFAKQMLTLATKFDSNRFIFCWDSKNSYRKLEYPPYKSNRRKGLTAEQQIDMEDAFRQFDEVREVLLPMMGFRNIYHQSGYEADDLIAHIAWRLPDDTIICSTDNDLLQLLKQDRYCPIRIFNFQKIIDEAEFRKRWFNLEPIKWAHVKAIAGCETDDVEGLGGVGLTLASKYLAGELRPGKIMDKIMSKEGKDTINRNMPLVALPYPNGRKPIKIFGLYDDAITADNFRAIFGQYGFRSLLKDEEAYKWEKIFFGGGENGGKSGTNPVRKIQRD